MPGGIPWDNEKPVIFDLNTQQPQPQVRNIRMRHINGRAWSVLEPEEATVSDPENDVSLISLPDSRQDAVIQAAGHNNNG